METTNQMQPAKRAVSYAEAARRSQDSPVATSSSAKPERTPVPKPGQADADTTKAQPVQPEPFSPSPSSPATLAEPSTSKSGEESVPISPVSPSRAPSTPSPSSLEAFSEALSSPSPKPSPQTVNQNPAAQTPGPESPGRHHQTQDPATSEPNETTPKVSYAEALRRNQTKASSLASGSSMKATGTAAPAAAGADQVTSATSKQSSGPPPQEFKPDHPGPSSQIGEQPSEQPPVAEPSTTTQGGSKSKSKKKNSGRWKSKKNSAANPPMEEEPITSPGPSAPSAPQVTPAPLAPSAPSALPAPLAPSAPAPAPASVPVPPAPGNQSAPSKKSKKKNKKGKGVATAKQHTTTPTPPTEQSMTAPPTVGQALRQNVPLEAVDASEVDTFVDNKISEALAKEELRKWHFEQRAVRTQAMIAAHDSEDNPMSLWDTPAEWDVRLIYTHENDPTKDLSWHVHHDILSRESEFFKAKLPPKDSYGGYVTYDCSLHQPQQLDHVLRFMYEKKYEGGTLDLSNGTHPLDGSPVRHNVFMFISGLSVMCRSLMKYAATRMDEISDLILSRRLLGPDFCATHDIFLFTSQLTIALSMIYEQPAEVQPRLYIIRLAMARLLDVLLVKMMRNASFLRTMETEWTPAIMQNVVNDSNHFHNAGLLFDLDYEGTGLHWSDDPLPPPNQGSGERSLSGSSTETETPRPRGNRDTPRSQGAATAGNEGVDLRGGHQASDARGSAQASGQEGGKASVQASGQNTGKASIQPSGQGSGQNTGNASIQASGQASGQGSGKASEQASGKVSGQASEQVSGGGQVSGQVSGQRSGQVSSHISGHVSGQVGGQVGGRGILKARDAYGSFGWVQNVNLGAARGGATSYHGRRTVDGSEEWTFPTPSYPLAPTAPYYPSQFRPYPAHQPHHTYQSQQMMEPFRSQAAHQAYQALLAQQAQQAQQLQQFHQAQQATHIQQAHQAQQASLDQQARAVSAGAAMMPAPKRRKVHHHPSTYSGVFSPGPSTTGLASPPSTGPWQASPSGTANANLPSGANPGARLVPTGMAFPPGSVFPGPSPALPPAAYRSPPPPPVPQGRHRSTTVVHRPLGDFQHGEGTPTTGFVPYTPPPRRAAGEVRPVAVRFADPVAVVVGGPGSPGPGSGSGGSGGSGGRGGGGGRGGRGGGGGIGRWE